jgi:alpha-1,2-mannosyltransferase
MKLLLDALVRRRVAVVAFLVPATVGFLAAVQFWRGLFDLRVYYGAINFWVDGGQLYDYLLPQTTYGFTYPPFAALVLLPLSVLSWPVAAALSLVVTSGALLLLTYWLVAPIATRRGVPVWFAVVVGACLLALLEPVYDTVSFGQVNLVLVILVFGDALLLARGSRLAGIGIGIAAAIKLTPGLFFVYLLLARRWTAALVAAAAGGAATMLTSVVAPEESRIFWTSALWQTDRVGPLSYISNQSLLGVLARLDPTTPPNRIAWLLAVLGVLLVWAYRIRRSVAVGDHLTGFALTGVVACLISPVSWVHHLVWAVPGLVLLAQCGVRAAPRSTRRRRLLVTSAAAYLVLCSSVVFLWRFEAGGLDGFLGGSAYVWVCLALLLSLPMDREPVVPVGQRLRAPATAGLRR